MSAAVQVRNPICMKVLGIMSLSLCIYAFMPFLAAPTATVPFVNRFMVKFCRAGQRRVRAHRKIRARQTGATRLANSRTVTFPQPTGPAFFSLKNSN
jgi:hypothetical protein